ncbi:MAG: nucleotidyl transferase AbiEii/AbiGii toxin family protein [Acidobacteriota bacterium]
MHKTVLSEEIKKSLNIISQQDFIKSFYLAGGTACTIHLGHRISNDLDFFTKEDFSKFEIQNSMRSSGNFLIDHTDFRTLIGRFNKTKISFFHYDYPLIGEIHYIFNLPIASLEDIGCMKIDAISSRGSRRDFIDLFFILQDLNLDLKVFFKYYHDKYSQENYNLFHILKSLVYFEDAENEPELIMLRQFSWEHMKNFFIEQIKKFKNF